MVDNSNIAHLDDYQRNAVLTFDEMKIRNDFVYQRSTGQLVWLYRTRLLEW